MSQPAVTSPIDPRSIAAYVPTADASHEVQRLLPGAAVFADPASLLKSFCEGADYRALLIEIGGLDALSVAAELKVRSEVLQLRSLPTTGSWAQGIVDAVRSLDAEPVASAKQPSDDLLLAAHEHRFSGTITFTYSDSYGCLWLEDGRIVRAETMASKGSEALAEIRRWRPERIEIDGAAAAELPMPTSDSETREIETMKAKETEALLRQLAELDGYIATAVVSTESGMVVAKDAGSTGFNIDVAAAANSELVKAKERAVAALGLQDSIEDILISLGKQYHLIRPLRSRKNYFFYLSLSKQQGNLAMARFKLEDIEAQLSQLL